MSLLQIKDLKCQHDEQVIVEKFSLELAAGTLACLLGPSGCGKTTVLRAIAGFQPISQGEITLDSRLVGSASAQLPPEQRGIGMVFQDYALFPHLTVARNIAFGLRRLSSAQQQQRAEHWLKVVGLDGLADRYPHELSGGQQQRVALARALAPEPKLILFDEPFSNLDVEMRERLATDIRTILKSQGATALFVTHDQNEAFAIGDRVGVMQEGQVLQWDTPFNLYHEPQNRTVANFIGQGVLLKGFMHSDNAVSTALGIIRGKRSYPWRDNTAVDVLLRPDDVVIRNQGEIRCRITDRAFKGAETLYELQLKDGQKLLSLMPSHDDYQVGQLVSVDVCADHLVVFA